MDCSLPGSSVHWIFQARVLEWGAITFSVPSVRWGFNPSWPSSQWPQHLPLLMLILSLTKDGYWSWVIIVPKDDVAVAKLSV